MKCILPFVCLVFLFSCIERIDLEVEEPDKVVVVDGIFSSGNGEKVIRLSKTLQVNSQINLPLENARVFVEDDQGQRIFFSEHSAGVYKSMSKAKSDHTYRLFAELPDGRTITSNYQAVPDSFSIAEINTVDTLATFLNESGATQRQKSLVYFAVAKKESVENDFFLRFRYETAYQVLESKCGPFHITKACYFYNDERPFAINLIEINKYDSVVEFETMVLRRKIDFRLSELFGLDLRLLSYNKAEFEYWQNLKKLFDQEGNINDVNPARLIGNITADDGTEILGQFAVVGESRKIKLVGNADFPTSRLPFCGFAGNRPFPLPDECCDCLGLNGATLLRPDFWP